MSKRFDAAVKGMLEYGPSDWPALAGFPGRKAKVTDADVSTVSAASDKVLRVRGKPDWLMDINFQAGPDASVPQRVHLYNTLLVDRHGLLVRSLVVLLAPRANLTDINGVYVQQFEGEEPHLTFRYRVIRVWQLPAAQLLAGGLGTFPLAPVSDVTERDLPRVIRQMKARLDAEPRPDAKELWTATYLLMGLRYEQLLVDRLLREVVSMEESVTYQAILQEGFAKGRAEGRQEGALQESRKNLLLVGTKRLGAPGAETAAALEGIADLGRLEGLIARALEVSSWEELLESPGRFRRRRKRTP